MFVCVRDSSEGLVVKAAAPHRSASLIAAAGLALVLLVSARAHAQQGGSCGLVSGRNCDPSSGSPCRANTPTCSAPLLVGTCNYPLLTAGTRCTADAYTCTSDVCDAAGTCLHTPDHNYCATTFNDNNTCTLERCTLAANPSGCANVAALANGNPCDDANACTDETRCSNGTCVGGTPRTCDDGMTCTSATCNPLIGCQTNFDDGACDDHNPCTIDDCDGLAGDGCRHINRPNGVFVAHDVPCGGTEMCSDVVGDTTCMNGVPVTSCPVYANPLVTGDNVCSTREVAYGIVVDVATAEPVGTIRCWREVGSHVVACDKAHPENPESTEAKVYAGLYCPAD